MQLAKEKVEIKKSPNLLVETFSIVCFGLVRFGTANMGLNPSCKKS